MSTAYTQADRHIALETPLGKDVLLLESFEGQETISRLFTYRLTLRSPDPSINGKDIVGKNVTFSVQDTTGERRYFNGYVSRFALGGRDERLRTYYAEVVPWLWFLTRTSDCRIFQNKSVPQIIEQIFTDLSFKDFTKSDIKGNHPQREYCVQYNETDFNFISRLMEEEGIFYFFRHENGKHTLVLADGKTAHRDGKHKELEFGVKGLDPQNELQLASWSRRFELLPGICTHTDYNFETPTVDLMTKTNTVMPIDGDSTYEVYEYPGTFRQRGEGESLSKIRMEEREAAHDVVDSASFSRWLSPGEKFKVKAHTVPSEKGKGFLITSVAHSAHVGANFETGEAVAKNVYRNSFTCISDAFTFRPQRTTAKPRVHGVQTAVVTGPPGEEIWPDKYGRVRVQFFWDREGKKDDKSACWVRVAHYWAGKQWGAMNIPRVGHEVLVDFIDGDVDRPVIVGSLYNAVNMPAYELPKFKTLSYVKTDTSPGSKGFNELRFEDKQGKEQVFIHSQKRMDTRVQGSLFETIGGSRNESIGVPSDKNKDGGSLNITVGGEYNLHVMKDSFIGLDKKLNMTVKGDVVQDFEKSLSTSVRTKAELNAQEITLEALTKITLKVGSSFIIVDLTGVTIMGPMVMINSGGTAVGTSPAGIDDPVDADTADTGEPGFLERPRPAGGGGGHHHRTLTPQQGLNVTRNADGSYQVGKGIKVKGNPAFAEAALSDLSKINETPSGQKLLNDLNTSGKNVTISERAKNPADPFNAETTPDNIADATPPGKTAFGGGAPVTDAAGNPVIGTGNGSDSSVVYDPSVWPPPKNLSPTGTTSDDTLFHELTHADHHEHGTRDASPRTDNFDNNEEFPTINDENKYRGERNPPLDPLTNGHHEL